MFGYITGTLIGKNEKSLLVLAQNVGYKIFSSTGLISKARLEQKIQLHLHTAVREDSISLYGFEKPEELEFFEQLMTVSGIGPKIALEILSAPVGMTQQAIIEGDTATLTKIKGLGKKTAERLILELKNKITPISLEKSGRKASYDSDAVEALVSLGYEKYHVIKVLSDMPATLQKTEDIVRYYLKQG